MRHSYFLTVTPRDEQLPVYLCTVGHVHQRPTQYPNGCPNYHWLHTISGKGMVELLGDLTPLPHGRGFLMYPGTPCNYWPTADVWEVMWLTFNGKDIDRFLQAWGMTPGFIDLFDVQYLCSKINDLLTRAAEQSDYTSAVLSGLLYSFLLELGWQSSREERQVRQRKRLAPVTEHIHRRYSQPISLDELANLINITPQHLCRMFRSVFGVTPISYLTTYRIIKSKELLLHQPDLTVEEVANRVGFSSLSYFCTIFRRYEKTTPAEFRRANLRNI
ncbi:MAG: AraC family transcriptional regulator [Limnochordia bacterium]|nr:AraC family transcriptional regulator [Limnochordia bacterium]MDD4518607.1 AraC family transcriptional regulator [Limnochordia bacterium]